MRAMGVRFTASVFAAAVAVVVVAGEGCGTDNSIVDGDCAAGYILCDGRCVAADDPAHCGRCNNACPPGVGCSAGVCGGPIDGSPTDGSLTDGSPTDGSLTDGAGDGSLTDGPVGDGPVGDGPLGDGSDGGGSDGGGDAADACPPPPYDKPTGCGACGVVCMAPDTRCGSDGAGGFTCQPPCVFPEIECDHVCVDGQNDPLNCGACGKTCPSNLCIAGVCQGATPGDVVVIGHDYRFGGPGSAQARVVQNAALIPSSNPVRVLSYEEDADAQAVANVKDVLNANAAGRNLAYTVTNDGAALAAPDLVMGYDVVLVYDQMTASAAKLGAVGAAAAAPLATFAKAGGVVIVLDGAAGQGNMPTFLTAAGLLDVPSHASIPNGSQIRVVAPADVVATGVLSPYGSFQRSVTFTTNEPNGGNVIWVGRRAVGAALGNPVIVHKVVP